MVFQGQHTIKTGNTKNSKMAGKMDDQSTKYNEKMHILLIEIAKMDPYSLILTNERSYKIKKRRIKGYTIKYKLKYEYKQHF